MAVGVLIPLLLVMTRVTWGQTPGINFMEAIQDVDTLPPTNELLVLTEKSESQSVGENAYRIQTGDFPLDCGYIETCAPLDNGTGENHDGVIRFGRGGNPPLLVDYSKNPFYCRCDGDCPRYGDCCRTLLAGKQRRTERNPWKCGKFHEKADTYALMVSECPDHSPSSLTDFCSATPQTNTGDIPIDYDYLLDIPVYSTSSGNLYRNIYCARCHREKNKSLVQWKTRLYCNVSLTPEEQEEFIQTATYVPGERFLEGNNTLCGIYISNLLNASVALENVIPNIRYCVGESIDSCPREFGRGNNATEDKIRDLCPLYTQYVRASKVNNRIFKNPHCALCNGLDVNHFIEEQNRSMTNLRCFTGSFNVLVKVVPGGQPSGPRGIHLLFDFSLDSHDNIVGYDTICKEDQIWDYLHKRCQMAICRKGYVLLDDECHPKPEDPSLGKDNDRQTPVELENGEKGNFTTLNGTKDYHGKDGGINSTCMRILLFEGEYFFVSKNNSSIIVNSTTNHGPPVIFHEYEYEYWNDTTLAVCAKDLHEGFMSRFSVVLNYISTISLAISVVFSFFHILLYFLLPKLRNLPGKNLFCLTLCLFISQLIFLTLINHQRWHELCVAAAVGVHYFYLAAFCWMNVMSFDMWRTFSGATILTRNQSLDRKQVTFLKYSVFSWLTPLIIVTIAILVEFLPSALDLSTDETPGDVLDVEGEDDSYLTGTSGENIGRNTAVLEFLEKIKPFYGQSGSCWFGQRMSLFIFFAAPVALIVISNLVLFSLTAKAILSQDKEAGKVLKNRDSVKSSRSKDPHGNHGEVMKAKLYAKLALIMGLTWILGFVSNFAGWDWLWFVFVLFNGLQGTFIFFAFDFKRKILGMVKERGAKNERVLYLMKLFKWVPAEDPKKLDQSVTISGSISGQYYPSLSTTTTTDGGGRVKKQNRSISFCGTTTTSVY